jgi:hypothetical protein
MRTSFVDLNAQSSDVLARNSTLPSPKSCRLLGATSAFDEATQKRVPSGSEGCPHALAN